MRSYFSFLHPVGYPLARMHPEDIEELENATAGEKQVFRFLHNTSRPDRDFSACYEPTNGDSGVVPDFVL